MVFSFYNGVEFSMESFMDELQDKKVISKNDVLILKQYINKKYSSYTQVQKLNVLTSSIHQVLDKNIVGIEETYTSKIKQEILKNTLLKDGSTIFLIDIFNTCISKKDAENSFYESIVNWVNSKVENKISLSELEKFDIQLETSKEKEITTEPEKTPPEVIKSEITKPENIKCEIEPKQLINQKLKTIITSKIVRVCVCTLFIFCTILQNTSTIKSILNPPKSKNIKISSKKAVKKSENFVASSKIISPNMPSYFNYKDINKNSLKRYLHNKNSLLCEEPYFSTLITVAKEFNLNPLILFAITGQEQSFVPVNNQYAKKIVNNPFNVYHSWQEYNTNLKDAAEIASRTVINLCKDRPSNEEPFHWINRKYAEDPKWGEGVLRIYTELEKNNKTK